MSDNKISDRKFTIEGLGDFYIKTPSAEDIRSSDWNYSKVTLLCKVSLRTQK